MSYLKTLALCLLGAIGALLFLQSIALADAAGGVPTDGLPLPTGYAGLVMFVLVAVSWAVRRFTNVAFFHSTAGAAVAGVASATFPSLITAVQMHGLNLNAIVTAFLGGFMSFVASDNASNTRQEQAAKVAIMKAGGTKGGDDPPSSILPGGPTMLPLFLALMSAFMALPGCATCTIVDNATCARKIVNGIDTVNGIVARSATRYVHDCRDGANLLVAEGRIADAREAYAKCEQNGSIILLSARETQSGAQATADGIDVYEAAGRKDYPTLFISLRSAVTALYKALEDAGLHIQALPSVDTIFGGK